MRRREFIALLGCGVTWPVTGSPQSPTARPLVAILIGESSTSAIFLNSFILGMQELGYVEGRNVDIKAFLVR
jgi:hypothetical protein